MVSDIFLFEIHKNINQYQTAQHRKIQFIANIKQKLKDRISNEFEHQIQVTVSSFQFQTLIAKQKVIRK